MRQPALLLVIGLIVESAVAARADQAGFAFAPSFTCPATATAMARLELYFGMSRADGAEVADAEWSAFVAREVTPRFPDGLTILSGYGQWRNSEQAIVREASRLVIILYQPSSDAETRIEAVRAAYKTAFQQESVMRIDSASCVSF